MFNNRSSLFCYCSLILLLFTLIGTVYAETLTIYSGRSKSLVEPIIKQFEEASGIQVEVSYAGTTQLAAALLTEGDKSPASLFWAQDAGALGAVSKKEMFEKTTGIHTYEGPFGGSEMPTGFWVATSGRARVLAYSPERVKMEELPESIFDLTRPMWKGRGRLGTNERFVSSVLSLR